MQILLQVPHPPRSLPLSDCSLVLSQDFLTPCLSLLAAPQNSALMKHAFCYISSLQNPKPFHYFTITYSIKSDSSVGHRRPCLINPPPAFPTLSLSLPSNESSAPAASSPHCPRGHCSFPPLLLCSDCAPEQVGIPLRKELSPSVAIREVGSEWWETGKNGAEPQQSCKMRREGEHPWLSW